ncbi:hypothetical protein [Jiella marina]|uniref:hypothetical protein n=1 Tax=Jiella sp. LLJ827 TaxID=2917712 RepID=UPI00210090D2|nr:hypothetical protein [Jiella sp. LLJ827]MCQ0990146.1 hypothetical protein [Jiella sp. LLJ827]
MRKIHHSDELPPVDKQDRGSVTTTGNRDAGGNNGSDIQLDKAVLAKIFADYEIESATLFESVAGRYLDATTVSEIIAVSRSS